MLMSGAHWPAPNETHLFGMASVCGGFTTFSSFSLQTLSLPRSGQIGLALANIGLSGALCLAAAASGYWVGPEL